MLLLEPAYQDAFLLRIMQHTVICIDGGTACVWALAACPHIRLAGLVIANLVRNVCVSMLAPRGKLCVGQATRQGTSALFICELCQAASCFGPALDQLIYSARTHRRFDDRVGVSRPAQAPAACGRGT